MSNYYYTGADPAEQPLVDEQQQQQQPDIRPEGMSTKQDDIIQRVAEFVVNSCDGAKYQHKLRRRTKFNSYFAFLDPEHPYHAYYEYLIKSYQYWKDVRDALSANAGQDQEAYAYYQQQLFEEQQQQQQEIQPYYSYNSGEGSYASGAGGAFQYGDLASSSGRMATDARGGEGGGGYAGMPSGYPPSPYGDPYDPTAVGDFPHPASGWGGEPANPAQDEEVEEEYELVIENGMQKLVPKAR
ncbi:unnamed protein product [Phytomonas sp. EM1]|nr:unnamed protein product [Phytomonas sp. EM1]|eukprot:CCW64718.1 unnamed protein product [Phytomonas sp. isolate EM1]